MVLKISFKFQKLNINKKIKKKQKNSINFQQFSFFTQQFIESFF